MSETKKREVHTPVYKAKVALEAATRIHVDHAVLPILKGNLGHAGKSEK